MAETTEILKGQLEDHLGRVIHPDSEADQIAASDGRSVETWLKYLENAFSWYIPKDGGGSVNGPLIALGGIVTAGRWACVSSGSDGHVMIAQNAYKDFNSNQFRYLYTHENMGARGVVFRHGIPGIWWFDTGMVPTTENTEFTPNFISLDNPDAKIITGQNLNDITTNGRYAGERLGNSPDGATDWWYIDVIRLPNTGVDYALQVAWKVNDVGMRFRNRIAGTWHGWRDLITDAGGNITGELRLNGQRIPTQYLSTAAPTASDGQDGDVWDVYV